MQTVNSRQIVWGTKKDIPHFLEINTASAECLWRQQDFADLLSDRKILCFKVVEENKLLGFVFYTSNKTGSIIKHMAVHPDYQRQGIGKMMIDKIKTLLNDRKSILYCVRDTNVAGHLFLQAQGFLMIETMSDYFEESYAGEIETQDGYLFAFCLT